mgnify:CR=1 FL=1
MNKIILSIVILFLGACAIDLNIDASKGIASTKETELKLPNDIRWTTNSSEYQILCEQIYENAWNSLSKIIKTADSQSVIIMDLDETVLDNSKYQIDLTKKWYEIASKAWGNYGPTEFWIVGNSESEAIKLTDQYCELRIKKGRF